MDNVLAKAKVFFDIATELGEADALVSLFHLHTKRKGANDKEMAKAMTFLKRAAELYHADALCHLGGSRIQRDPKFAVELLKRTGDSWRSHFFLGDCHWMVTRSSLTRQRRWVSPTALLTTTSIPVVPSRWWPGSTCSRTS